MPLLVRRALFLMFFLSGFCGLVYQIVWLRMAFASFGIITPVLSVVIATFMMGLGIGSMGAGWLCDKVLSKISSNSKTAPLFLYGLIELGIACSALVVPFLFRYGEGRLLASGGLDSGNYLFVSALWISLSILPWCILMGATFPTAMAFVKSFSGHSPVSGTSFSFLYLANVIGAMCGTVLTALVFVEVVGFRGTLWIAALCNASIAVLSFSLAAMPSLRKSGVLKPTSKTPANTPPPLSARAYESVGSPGLALYVLFITGFCSMGMEVVWTRAFTPLLRTTIYAFAGLLCLYLLATWIGSYQYRKALARREDSGKSLWTIDQMLPWLAITAILPLTLNDPRLQLREVGFVLSVFPFCYLLGYLTPRLVDAYSEGSPARAGKAYAINVLGCIVGPLVAGYLLLPHFGVKLSLVLLALPFALHCAQRVIREPQFGLRHGKKLAAMVLLLVFGTVLQRTWEDKQAGKFSEIYRDHTATVIATGDGVGKQLYVNGIGITILDTITKIMAHLPMAFAPQPPQKSLVICFGMGTTFRSLASWGGDTTAVELLASVRDAFGFFFSDAEQILASPHNRIVIDDGRRFLSRTREKFDVITIDPPPPVQAAGSSLLYSSEFYKVVKTRLTTGGILQQWIPGADRRTLEALSNSIHQNFAHVRVFHSAFGWGIHFLASNEPIELITAQTFVDRMPLKAQRDLLEWTSSGTTVLGMARDILSKEASIESFLPADKKWMLTDEHPINEYYLLRLGPELFNNAMESLKKL